LGEDLAFPMVGVQAILFFIPCLLFLAGHFCPLGGIPEQYKCRFCPLPNLACFAFLALMSGLTAWTGWTQDSAEGTWCI